MRKYNDYNIDYNEIIENAMRGALYVILKRVEKEGLSGKHYFVISFSTAHKGVVISDKVKQQNPDKISIVLQYQFDNLVVDEEYFQVNLSFNGVAETVRIPFKAILSFSDPSVNFEIIFETEETGDLLTPDLEKNKKNVECKTEDNLIYFSSLKNKK